MRDRIKTLRPPPKQEELNTCMVRDWGKWPQMLTTGKSVTVDQAKEIIRRTDRFFDYQGGNDKNYVAWAKETIGFPKEGNRKGQEWSIQLEVEQAWKKAWDYIHTSYVSNSWISCAFIFGPHGWMHPDGRIGFVDNIGRWPNAEAVVEDWQQLVTAFPFLDVGVTLYADEGEGEACLCLKIEEGHVKWYKPGTRDVHADHPKAERGGKFDSSSFERSVMSRLYSAGAEQGLSRDWIREYGDKAVELGLTPGWVEQKRVEFRKARGLDGEAQKETDSAD